ncbi:MAG: hypothetical protein IID42_04545 [Planctomycetes bacterium]|nr:hypothetical protein [Planctomycetota bacterium]
MSSLRTIFVHLHHLTGADAYLFVDDLFHIRREDQARVLDYLHRIAKDNHLWLKIGTKRHRTVWYKRGDAPLGMRIGDDARDIDLDLSLDRMDEIREYFREILKSFVDEAGLGSIEALLTGEAMTRLVVASGAVPRDAVSICIRAVDIAVERMSGNQRQGSARRIDCEDINEASRSFYERTKMVELQRDTSDDERNKLLETFDRVRSFCQTNGKTWFLVNADYRTAEASRVKELLDLKLVHLIRRGLTLRGGQRGRFDAYLLDLSQWIVRRRKGSIQTIDFNARDLDRQLRRAGLIYPDQGD